MKGEIFYFLDFSNLTKFPKKFPATPGKVSIETGMDIEIEQE